MMAEDGAGVTEEREREEAPAMNRKEKRKAMKKMKRKQLRREAAAKEREEEEARENDSEEQMRRRRQEEEEAARMERERREFEERERRFLMALEEKRKMKEEEEQRKLLEEESQVENQDPNEPNEGDDEWEYIEEGPAEIIWKGNEIIVKKKKVKVPKKRPVQENVKEEIDGPISNPLAPQSEALEDYKTAQEVLESVAQQVPNFGTEQDKAHCPFHLKTGACRFGIRCSRVHFYPDRSCTLLMKNMYNGPGLAWEQDEGLEYHGEAVLEIGDVQLMLKLTTHTDEEVERCFEDFYEDVHTEFLKFGEIVNFKVCKNGSSHLRGNVYVHYKSLDSAVHAYQSINGRYFAGKQITCEFVNVTKWKVAICGEYMKSRFKTCSRGSACNFIHCFRNPGGDYMWADWDKPAPSYWVREMAALFGYTNLHDEHLDEFSPRKTRSSSNMVPANADSYHSRRSQSRDSRTARSVDEDDRKSRDRRRHRKDSKKFTNHLDEEAYEEKMTSKDQHRTSRKKYDSDADDDLLDTVKDHHGCSDRKSRSSSYRRSRSRSRETYEERMISEENRHSSHRKHGRDPSDEVKYNDRFSHRKSRSRTWERDSKFEKGDKNRETHFTYSDSDGSDLDREEIDGRHEHENRSSRKAKTNYSSKHRHHEGDYEHRPKKKSKIEEDDKSDGCEAEYEEKVYRLAALKRLREMRKSKDTESDGLVKERDATTKRRRI